MMMITTPRWLESWLHCLLFKVLPHWSFPWLHLWPLSSSASDAGGDGNGDGGGDARDGDAKCKLQLHYKEQKLCGCY